MGTPRELLNICLGETLRLLIAMRDQRDRIDAAAYELRKKPDSDVFARIVDPNTVEKHRTLNEVQFFFVAVRGILAMATAMKDAAQNGGFFTVHEKVCAAVERFNQSAPHASDMRDFLTHMDAYMAGTGNLEVPHPEHKVWLVTPDDDVGLYVAGVALSVQKTETAAEDLGFGVRDAVRTLEELEKAGSG